MSASLRFRVIGVVIATCGLALCHGALQLWPADVLGSSPVIDALRILAASISAVLGVANVAAGLVILFAKPARE